MLMFLNTLAAGLHRNHFPNIVTHLHKQCSQVSMYSFQISIYLHPLLGGSCNNIRVAKTVQKSERKTSETRICFYSVFKNRPSPSPSYAGRATDGNLLKCVP